MDRRFGLFGIVITFLFIDLGNVKRKKEPVHLGPFNRRRIQACDMIIN